jgi:hypothetical protein
MEFIYEVVRLWERPAEELLAADLGVAPLAMLGRLPEGLSLEDGLTAVARQVVERLMEAPPDRAKKLLTDALLLTSSSCRRPVAAEGAEHLVEVGGDDHLVVEEILQPQVVVPVGQRDQRQQVAEADAHGGVLALAVRGFLG